jgi:Bacterial PH domain
MAVICFGPMLALMAARVAGVPIGRSSGGPPVVLLAIMVIVAATMVSTRYIVSEDMLTVWCGPIRRRRRLKDVTRLRTTRSIESSPAWSFDRIEIGTIRGFWLNVSPADKAGFVRAVMARAPHVSLDAPLATLAASHERSSGTNAAQSVTNASSTAV